MRTRLLLAAGLTAAGMLAGCAGGAYYVSGPPAPRYGVVGAAPGPGFVWTEGFYDLRGSNWVWTPGLLAASPCAGSGLGCSGMAAGRRWALSIPSRLLALIRLARGGSDAEGPPHF